MKINKLLFFLLALVSLSSCVEYVHNGTGIPGSEIPEPQNFTAKQSNADTATKVGDKFEFVGLYNNVDVTNSTKFKVNGADIPGNSYTPFKEGNHSVVATYNNLTYSFKFNVLPDEEEPEPEPTGNRIEYNNNSYPVSETAWYLNVNSSGQVTSYNVQGTTCTLWAMMSTEYDSSDEVVNQFLTFTMVPVLNQTTVAFPNEAPSALKDAGVGGVVTINGTEVFDITGSTYTFASTGNTVPSGWQTQQPPWTGGTANVTATATGASSGNSAQLFWEGAYTGMVANFAGKSAKTTSIKTINLTNLKGLNSKQISQLNDLKKYEVKTTLNFK